MGAPDAVALYVAALTAGTRCLRCRFLSMPYVPK